MSKDIVTSVMLNTVAHFWRVMEKSGMTPKHVQRVIERPKLREAIVALIEADMVMLWRPADNPSRVPTNLAHWTDPFDKVFDYFDETDTVSLKAKLDSLIKAFEGNDQDIIETVFNDRNRDRNTLVFLYHYGLIGDRPVSIEELASGFDVTPTTIGKDIKGFRRKLQRRITELLHQQYSPVRLLDLELVTPEWAASTDDIGILGLSTRAFNLVGLVARQSEIPFWYRIRRISQLTALTEAQLNYWATDAQNPVEEIKTALAKFGLSLDESAPDNE